MKVEIDEVMVNIKDWSFAQIGNPQAIARVRAEIDGLTLFFYKDRKIPSGYAKVTLRDLQKYHIIGSVIISANP